VKKEKEINPESNFAVHESFDNNEKKIYLHLIKE
jgi:hypothetical protein